ncbi:MAG: C45 family autoproteolytic acyltransferase/hydrolase [Planctomycetota bacterium]
MRVWTFALVALVLLPGIPLRAEEETVSTEHGELFTVDGARVLKVWGTPRQRGRAHGLLLGREMMEVINAFLQGGRAKKFEQRVTPLVDLLFRWPKPIAEELEGLLEGLEKAVPEAKRKIASLDRTVTLNDLKAFNTLGDWLALACSTCTAWGASTEGGKTLVGRNFDYFLPPAALKHQLLIAQCAGEGTKAFVTVSFPGNLGVITFLNEDGVFGAVHDVHRLPEQPLPGYTPRLITLRMIAERVGPKNGLQEALALCRKHRSLYGNNFHIAVPAGGGADAPAGVIEYDSDGETDKGATLRLPGGEKPPRLWNTNHYRSRAPPSRCPRYAKLDEVFSEFIAGGKRFDVAGMKRLMKSAVQPSTMHQIIAELETMTFHLALQKKLLIPASEEPFHVVRWEDLFGKRQAKEKEDSEF